MKTLTFTITIDKPQDFIFNKMIDKSSYSSWTSIWGKDLTFEGNWNKGEHISFMDNVQGGTKVIVEDIHPHEFIKLKHTAMVDLNNQELELSDENMRKWIGSLEQYYFKKINDNQTQLEIILVVDPTFQEMFDTTWPTALKSLKQLCEA